jgi:phospholipid N-methyltransferase
MPRGSYLKNYLKDIKIGAVAPSSRFVIKKIIKQIHHDTKYIVEYGAGDGVMTKELLKILPRDGVLVAVETNNTLIKDLKKIHDKRLVVVHDDVLAVSRDFSQLGLPRIDVVISGIPLSFFKSSVRKDLIKRTAHGIARRGQFIVYQYSILVFPILKKHFKTVKLSFEPRNFLPYFIMNAERPMS